MLVEFKKILSMAEEGGYFSEEGGTALPDMDRILEEYDIDHTTKYGGTLDEIQECPAALTSLKYFCEEARQYHIVAAGSLLGLYEHSGTGFPVGKVDITYLYPMNFCEFLHATGHELYVEALEKQNWSLVTDFGSKYADLLKLYYVIGGMPEAVLTNNSRTQANRSPQGQGFAAYKAPFSFGPGADRFLFGKTKRKWGFKHPAPWNGAFLRQGRNRLHRPGAKDSLPWNGT